MSFISSSNTNNGKSKVSTVQGVSTFGVQVSTANIDVATASLSHDIMDINWNLALLSMRADRAPRSQDKGRRESYKKDPKVEEPTPKAMIAIDGIVCDWSYMADEDENHALVANEEEVPIEYALMAKSSSSSDNEVYDDSYCSKSCKKNTKNLNNKIIKLNKELSDCETDLYNYKRGLSQVEARLVEFKNNEIKFCERIRVLERDIDLKDNKIENLRNELEELKKEKDSIDKFENFAKDLDCLLGTQRSVKDKTSLGLNEYTVVPPPPAQVYSPPKNDLSWTGLPEFVNDTVTDYSRPTPSIDVPRDVGESASFFKQRGSVGNVLSKPMISFVKETGCPSVPKVINTENSRKPTMKYAEMYRNTSKSPKVMSNNFSAPIIEEWDSEDESEVDFTLNETVRSSFEQEKFDNFTKEVVGKKETPKQNHHRGNQRNWNNQKSQQLGKDFVMQNKACYNCSSFEHLKFDCKQNTRVNKGKIWSRGILQDNINDKGYWDSGCSRHMTGNISYLSEYEPYDGGYMSFGHEGGKITGKGTIKTGKLEFENVYFVKELKYNLFSVSQICDNKNSVLFTDFECLVLGKDFKLDDDTHVLLRTPRQQNMYSIDLKNIVPHKNLTCLIAKASEDESMLWHRRLGHLNFKTMNKLVRNNLVKGLPSKSFENIHTCVACLKGKQHKASCKTKLVSFITKPLHTLHMDLFGPTSVSILNHKWYCLVVTDGFSRFTWTFFLKSKDETSSILRNFITEIENLKDLKVKIIRCDNGGKFRNKEMDEFCTRKGIKREFSNARTPQQNGVAKLPSFLRPFGCHVMILNTLDHLGKFDAKGDEGYFVGYSMSSKAFKVFNKRTKKIEENLHVDFLENQPIEKGSGPNWLFDIDSLTESMNYVPVVVAGTSSTNISGTKEVANQTIEENVSTLRFIALPNWFHEAQMATSIDFSKKNDDSQKEQDKIISNSDAPESSGNSNPTATAKDPATDQVEHVLSSTVETEVPTVSSPVPIDYLSIPPVSSSGPRIISRGGSSYQETPSLGNAMSFENRLEDLFGDTTASVSLNEVEADLSNMETNIQVSLTSTLRIHKVHPKSQIIGHVDTPIQTRQKTKNMEEQSFIATIHQKTNLELLKVRPIGIKWVLKNKRDARGIVIRNKARLVAQRYTQEEGIDYKEVFALVARIEAIRLFLAYASYMGFTVYQMDVKSAFLYETIDEEVYVMQPPGFQDSQFLNRVYKVVKAMYGLHQAHRAWYGTLSKYLLDNGFQRDTIDQTLLIRKHKGEFLLVQVYVDDIIFGSSNPKLCREFETLMHEKIKMSAMGELKFFLGLQVLQKKDDIFLS
ncbi:ribonuclease H-like domain-containing protein [Tanacetum coccineum]